MSSLVQLAKQFKKQHITPNPPSENQDSETVNAFCYSLKLEEQPLNAWSDDEWVDAMLELGVPPEETCFMAEIVASWGSDD